MGKGWLIGGGALLVLLLVVSVVVALTRREATFPPDSPEAAVQRLLRAVKAEDYETVHSLLSARLRQECALEDLVRSNLLGRGRSDFQAVLESTSRVGDVTLVKARITQFYGRAPFGASESTWELAYTLRQEEGQWRFDEYPWPVGGCPKTAPLPPSPPD